MLWSVTAEDSTRDNESVLAAFGIDPGALLGRGGEASIYGLDGERILRLMHPGRDPDQLRRNQMLLEELDSSAVPFELPQVLEIGEIEGRIYAIEPRLPGRPLAQVLGEIDGPKRDRLIGSYVEAAQVLADLRPEGWPYFGELAAARPRRTEEWKEFLAVKAAQNLMAGGHSFDEVDAAGLAVGFPDPPRAEFVHLDIFPGNVLTDGKRITAVLDIGYACLAGDCRFNPLLAALYLEPNPEMPQFPFATWRDHEIARDWLRSAGFLDLLEPARRWLAAYWSFAVDDLPLQAWCQSVLLP